ncbi:hypothetical protein UJ101_00197 [Flavobacteriaceae bacterium UJ101]|nr:hypothetical protein UJ101_00197 [Flavobacteriaceae bacterium UJ101]
MKKLFFIVCSSILLMLTSCKVNEQPEYERMENIKVTKLGLKNIQLQADAVFNNPNVLGVTIKRSDIDVFKDSIYLGKAKSPSFEVNKESEFSIPLTIDFSPKKIIKEKGFLGNVLSTVSQKEMNITYKGTITLDVLGIEYDYDFEHTEPIVLKKEK